MARLALGIDGGGSKCDALVVAEDGTVVGRGRGGPTHVYYDPPEVISASYVEAITQALAGVERAEVWSAGYLPEGAQREAIGARNRHVRHIRASEVDTGFASAQEGWGMIVLAGTGSFVHGRSPDGQDRHFGGLGPILNDYGSAYEIGLLGLRAAFASDWTAARRTSLAEAMSRALGVADRKAVFHLVYVKGLGRRQIAALAEVVNEEAERGDAVALSCIQRAADELAEVARDVIGELQMARLSFPVIAIGSVARNCRLWWERVCARIAEVAPDMRPVVPVLSPAAGAALIALREMGVAWTEGILCRLGETQGARQ